MNEDPQLCPPAFLSNLSSDCLRADHRDEVGVDQGSQQGLSGTDLVSQLRKGGESPQAFT